MRFVGECCPLDWSDTTRQLSEAEPLLMFAGAVAVSPVFTSWPSPDAASMTGWFTALYTPTHLPFNLQNYLSSLPVSFVLSTALISHHLHLLIQFSLTSVRPHLSFNSLFTSADSPSLPVPSSQPCFLSLADPVTVSKVLMRSYPTLHCLIRCCWLSRFCRLDLCRSA